MSLLCLPNELIHQICIYTSSHRRKLGYRASFAESQDPFSNLRALSRLSQTSRRLYEIATPVLYHTMFYDGKSPAPLLLFLRTLAQHPSIACHVKDMSLGTFTAIDKNHEPVIDDIMASLESCLPETWYYSEERCQSHERQRQDYITSLKYDSTLQHGFTINLILSLVTNLSELSFKPTAYSKYGQDMLPSANLDTLRELSLIGDELGRFKLRQVKDLCKRAPKLEKLTFDSCVRTASNLPLDNLTSLKFENSLIAKGDLRKLVKSCSKLTSFTYHSSNSLPMYEALNRTAPLLTPRDIVEELSPCKETLQHLDVVFSDWAVQIYLWNNNVLITSMKEFSNLKTLKLNEICFYCELTENKRIISTIDDLLPPSIEVVVLDQIRPQSSVMVEELERHARAQPNLRDFTIYKSAELDWWMREYQ